MILNNVNELYLIKYLETFSMIDINHESLISQHLLNHIFGLSAI